GRSPNYKECDRCPGGGLRPLLHRQGRGERRPALRREVLRIRWRQARRDPIICRAGRQNGLSGSLKSPARVKKIDQQKAARPPCPLALKSTQITHLVKVSNPTPLTFQLQRGRLADGYSEIRCNSREKTGYARGSFRGKPRQKKKKRGAV